MALISRVSSNLCCPTVEWLSISFLLHWLPLSVREPSQPTYLIPGDEAMDSSFSQEPLSKSGYSRLDWNPNLVNQFQLC